VDGALVGWVQGVDTRVASCPRGAGARVWKRWRVRNGMSVLVSACDRPCPIVRFFLGHVLSIASSHRTPFVISLDMWRCLLYVSHVTSSSAGRLTISESRYPFLRCHLPSLSCLSSTADFIVRYLAVRIGNSISSYFAKERRNLSRRRRIRDSTPGV
jgi:hypothetical protein